MSDMIIMERQHNLKDALRSPFLHYQFLAKTENNNQSVNQLAHFPLYLLIKVGKVCLKLKYLDAVLF